MSLGKTPLPVGSAPAFPEEPPTLKRVPMPVDGAICPACNGTAEEVVWGFWRVPCWLCLGDRIVPEEVRLGFLALQRWLAPRRLTSRS